MGIAEWVARRGNVGGTARWAAKLYHKLLRRNPTYTTDEIVEALIYIRYPPDKSTKDNELAKEVRSLVEPQYIDGKKYAVDWEDLYLAF